MERLTYNLCGSQISSEDALGSVTSFTYDRNRRQLTWTDALSYTETAGYDNCSNVYYTRDANGNYTYNFYDRFNQLIRVESPYGTTLSSYTYDLAGNMLTQKDGAGKVTENTYNVRGLPVKRGVGGQLSNAKLAEAYTYNADGSAATVQDRNGVTFTYLYDIHGLLTQKQASSGRTSLILTTKMITSLP